MNEPKRWLDDGAPDVIGRLLRAASDEHPSTTAVERAVAGVAIGAGVTGAGIGTAGASIGVGVKSAPLASGIFLKWTLLGTLVTLGAGGVAVGLSSPPAGQVPAPARLSPSTAAAAKTPVATVQQAEPAIADSVRAQHAASVAQTELGGEARRPSSSTKASLTPMEEVPVVDVELLARETKLVDRARAELAAGRASTALVTLDEYQAQFPRQRYAPEALYLRMQALLAQGNQLAARQVAKRLASSHPTSPHAARAEAVLSTSIP